MIDRTILYTRDIHEQPGKDAPWACWLPGDPTPIGVDEWYVENGVFYAYHGGVTVASSPNRGWVVVRRSLLAETSTQAIHDQTRQSVQDALASLGVKTPEPPIKWAA